MCIRDSYTLSIYKQYICVFSQLYEAFNVGEYQLEKSNQLAKELETLRYELEPLEEVSNSCPLLYSP